MKKVCKRCKVFVDSGECQICKGTNLTESWQGRINVTNVEKSEIAKEVGINAEGEYVIKAR